MGVHVAFRNPDGQEVHRCGKNTYFTFSGEKCHGLDCDARIVRLHSTLGNVRGRAYFIATDLINKWAWDRPEEPPQGGYSYEDLKTDIDDIIANLNEWKVELYQEIKVVPRD